VASDRIGARRRGRRDGGPEEIVRSLERARDQPEEALEITPGKVGGLPERSRTLHERREISEKVGVLRRRVAVDRPRDRERSRLDAPDRRRVR
jgi:hypothetical protein